MTTQAKHQEKKQATEENPGRRQLNALISKNLMQTLGQPGELERVQVRHLWDDHYRVNVLIGPDAASARVANSYFVVADGDGNILTSTPQLTRQYPTPEATAGFPKS